MLFLFVLLTHGLAGNITSFDSRWVIPVSLSLLNEGDFDLNEYPAQLEQEDYYATLCVSPDGRINPLPGKPRAEQRQCQGSYQYYYPLSVPALAAPVVWGIGQSLEVARFPQAAIADARSAPQPPRADMNAILFDNRPEVERFAASTFVALAAVFVYLLCLQELPRAWAAAMALVFAFATPAWSIGSRALWQHTLSMPLLAASLWILSAARRRPGLVPWAGLALMTAFWVRPTNFLSLAVFSLYVLAFHRQHAAACAAAMIPPLLLFGGINHSIYHTVLTPYSSVGRAAGQLSVHPRFGEALTANLISPGRGLFVFSPIFLLAGFACRGADEDRNLSWLRRASIVVVASHWILLSSFVQWWGGHCFGPRFFTDLAPLLVFLLIPAVQRIRAGNRPLTILSAVLLLWSVFVHHQGVRSQAAIDWSITPVSIDQSTWRVWDWSHTSFLAGLQPPSTEPKR